MLHQLVCIMCMEIVLLKAICDWTLQRYKALLYLHYLQWGRDQFETEYLTSVAWVYIKFKLNLFGFGIEKHPYFIIITLTILVNVQKRTTTMYILYITGYMYIELTFFPCTILTSIYCTLLEEFIITYYIKIKEFGILA